MSRNLVQAAGDGDVVTGPVRVHSVIFTGTDVAGNAMDLKDGSGGATRLTLKAVAGTSAVWRSGDREGVLFATSVNWGHSGAGAVMSVEYS